MPAPRKDDRLHELHSTIPHDRTPDATSFLVAGRPTFPKNVGKEEKRIYKLLCKQLAARRTLTEGDQHLLTLAADIWCRRDRAQAKLIVEGEIRAYTRLDPNGVAHEIEKPNLNLKIVQDCEKQLIAILDRLGLTPLAGSKVKPNKQDASLEVIPGSIADLYGDQYPELIGEKQ